MDANLIGAIITGVATVVAAVIGLVGLLKNQSSDIQKPESSRRIWKSLIQVRAFVAHGIPELLAKPGTLGPEEAQVIYDAYEVLQEERPNISNRLYGQVELLLIDRLQSDLNQLLGSIQELQERRRDPKVIVDEKKWLNRVNSEVNQVQDKFDSGLDEIDELIKSEARE